MRGLHLPNFKNDLNQATCQTIVITYLVSEVYNTNELKYNNQPWYSYKPFDMLPETSHSADYLVNFPSNS
jgi:hypothetical protein